MCLNFQPNVFSEAGNDRVNNLITLQYNLIDIKFPLFQLFQLYSIDKQYYGTTVDCF